MNPKDEVKFEDIKKLVNASLEKFYKNDRDLIEMSNEEDMISEQCMVFHIGSYMKNKMNTLTKFQWADLDCEYNRNMNDPKMMRSDRKIIDKVFRADKISFKKEMRKKKRGHTDVTEKP